MSKLGASRRRCASAWALLAAAGIAAGSCAKPERVQMGQVMRMGQFVLRPDVVRVERRTNRTTPLELRVFFTVGGGNRFDRIEFTETVSRKGHMRLSASDGWREPCWLSGTGEDVREALLVAYPPLGSSGYSLEIGNPYGEPKRFILDLGK